MESLKTALVVNIGTTVEPVIKALETAAGEGALKIFLAYGRAISDQEGIPFSITNIVVERAKQLGVAYTICELDAPEEFEGSLKFCRNLINEVERYSPQRVIVDITGGTKVMAAAMIHATLTQQWETEVVVEYVGGTRDSNGRVTEMVLKREKGIITQERISDVLDSIRQQEFTHATLQASSLSNHGKAGFLKKVSELLWLWDNFRYEEAIQIIEEFTSQAKILTDDKQYKKMAETILRLGKVSRRIKLAIETLRQMKDDSNAHLSSGALSGWINIISDTIANARRKVRTNPIDCVLRCYRAVEMATQITIVNLGINPWKPNWGELDNEKLKTYLSKISKTEPPRQVSLELGIRLIETLTSSLDEEVNKGIMNIMTSRNYSYLEHGYDKVSEHTAQSILTDMEKAVVALLSKANIKDDPIAIADQLKIEA